MTGSIALDFDKTLLKGLKMMDNKKTKSFGFYIVCSINLGLRYSDLINLSFEQLRNDSIDLIETKTKKKRTLKVNENIKMALSKYDGDEKGYAFTSQKGTRFTSQRINVLLKENFKSNDGTISSHSLRKTFGKRVYINNGESEKALIYLSELFNHSSLKVTRTYLGIKQAELNNIYMNL